MNSRQILAIIGSGPSCVYLLKHLLDNAAWSRDNFSSIEIFEKRGIAGMGMPYHPETTERYNLSNISSEELPELIIPFADWLRKQDVSWLKEFGIELEQITDGDVYPRLALGAYLHAQYHAILTLLAMTGIPVHEHIHRKIVDVRDDAHHAILVDDAGETFTCDRVVIATGHYWQEEDHPAMGYYASPWPISKLLPQTGEFLNFCIGTLGASLSAFDVVSSLAHRHGTFDKVQGGLRFNPHPGTKEFRIAMHSAEGLLPHLQYSQTEPIRTIERYISEAELLSLRDKNGLLRLRTYFNHVCRPVLTEAFRKDEMSDLVALLADPAFQLEDFAERMTEKHDYSDAFEGMRSEMDEAEKSVILDKPIHWKEAIDDLMYTLNFYAEMLPAEDHLTLRSKFLPFLMNVIAALPLASGQILLALHDAGKLDIVPGKAEVAKLAVGTTGTKVMVDNDGEKSEIAYRMFVDCSGQGALELDEFPFPSLVADGHVRQARAAFADPGAAEKLPDELDSKIFDEHRGRFFAIGGIDIDRSYQLIASDGQASSRVTDIAFPHTSGIRPYSYGLQACNETARLVLASWTKK